MGEGEGDLEEIIQSQRELKPRELERTETSYLHELKHPIRIKITDINNPFHVKNLKTRYFRPTCSFLVSSYLQNFLEIILIINYYIAREYQIANQLFYILVEGKVDIEL